ncbi:MAG: hypothetical protein FJ146_16170 [Deltaproteobacteria bacterium]|nr:hypothetical protein [Deltaproteobacteria bacterium]
MRVTAVSGSHSRCLALALTFVAAAASSCRASRSNSDPKFDWDTNLPPVTMPEASKDKDLVQYDRNFCKGMEAGSCFTLLMRIPREDLIQDLGLATLAVGAESRSFRAKLEESCQTAWTDYRQKHLNSAIRPLRNSLAQKIKKMRCVFLFMGEEVAAENLKLAPNEIAVSVRLTKFDINANTKGAQVRGIGLNLTSIDAVTDYRSAFLYSGEDVRKDHAGWTMAEGLGVNPIRLKARLEKDVTWAIDPGAILENLDKITQTEAGADDRLKSFLDQARGALTAVRSLENPIQSSIAVVTIGYNAVRGLCGEDMAKCKVTNNDELRTPSIKDDLSDLVPSSETNELLRLAMIRSIQGVLDSVLTDAKADQLKAKFNIN